MKCYKCKETKEPEHFHKDRTRACGYSSKCKDCMKVVNKAKRETDEGKAKAVILARRWKRNNKAKEHAHKAVARAVKAGNLIRPEQCAQCSSNEDIQGHHYDYSKQLDVVWLCRRCHLDLHIKAWEKKHATR